MSDDPSQTDSNDPDATLEEQLVAYLDHELDPEATRNVEALLARDSGARKTLARLERTWEALDDLGLSNVENSTTQSTLKMVAIAAEEEVRERSIEAPRQRQRLRLAGGAMLAVSAAIGFLAVVLLRPNPNRQLLDHLTIIENLDAYRKINSIEFLRLLDAQGLFAKKVEKPAKKNKGDTSRIRLASLQSSMAERRVWVENLDAASKEPLRRRFERFIDLDPNEQSRLRGLHESLLAEPNPEALLMVMCRYYEWLKTLEPFQEHRLRELPSVERVERIKHLQEEQARRKSKMPNTRQAPRIDRIMKAFQTYGAKGPPGIRSPNRRDVEGLLDWLDDYVAQHAPLLVESLPDPRGKLAQQWLIEVDDPIRRREILGQMWLRWLLRNPGTSPPITEKELADLRSKISPEARTRLEAMPTERQWQLILGWVRVFAAQHYSVRRSIPGLQVISNEELAEFLEDRVRPEDRDRLLGLPPEELRRELMQMLLRSQSRRAPGGRGPGPMRRPPNPRPGGFQPRKKRPGVSPFAPASTTGLRIGKKVLHPVGVQPLGCLEAVNGLHFNKAG